MINFIDLFSPINHLIKPITVKDILEDIVEEKYFCSQDFTNLLNRAVKCSRG